MARHSIKKHDAMARRTQGLQTIKSKSFSFHSQYTGNYHPYELLNECYRFLRDKNVSLCFLLNMDRLRSSRKLSLPLSLHSVWTGHPCEWILQLSCTTGVLEQCFCSATHRLRLSRKLSSFTHSMQELVILFCFWVRAAFCQFINHWNTLLGFSQVLTGSYFHI